LPAKAVLPFDQYTLTIMFEFGFTRSDLAHLEKLSMILFSQLAGKTILMRNKRDDVVKYLNNWADLLERVYLV